MFSSFLTRKSSICVGLAVLLLPLQAADVDAIGKALDHPNRPAEDRQLDAARKPAEVLHFFGIEPGMKVLDIFAGPGYYTEILNHLVGEQGIATMYTHTTWEGYSKKKSDARIANGRLQNVEQLVEDINTIELASSKYDAAMMVLGFHDMFLTDEKSVSGDQLDVPYFLKAIYIGLKPGGVFGVVEHLTAQGEPTNPQLHRMNHEHISRALLAAGFVLEDEADMLRNANDDHSKSVFKAEVRRKTDRVTMLFRKPVGSAD